MSSQYDKLFGKPAGLPAGSAIDGAFCCHHCDETVDEAIWYENEKLLVWKCDNGHISEIKEFAL